MPEQREALSRVSRKPARADVNASDGITMYSALSFSQTENRERKEISTTRKNPRPGLRLCSPLFIVSANS